MISEEYEYENESEPEQEHVVVLNPGDEDATVQQAIRQLEEGTANIAQGAPVTVHLFEDNYLSASPISFPIQNMFIFTIGPECVVIYSNFINPFMTHLAPLLEALTMPRPMPRPMPRLNNFNFNLQTLNLELGEQDLGPDDVGLAFFPVPFLTAILNGPARSTLQKFRIMPNKRTHLSGAILGTHKDYLAFSDALQNATALEEFMVWCEWTQQTDRGQQVDLKSPEFLLGPLKNKAMKRFSVARQPTANSVPNNAVNTNNNSIYIRNNNLTFIMNAGMATATATAMGAPTPTPTPTPMPTLREDTFASQLQEITLSYPIDEHCIGSFVAAIKQLHNLSFLSVCLEHLEHSEITVSKKDLTSLLTIIADNKNKLAEFGVNVLHPAPDKDLESFAKAISKATLKEFLLAIPSAHLAIPSAHRSKMLDFFRPAMACNVYIQTFEMEHIQGPHFLSDVLTINEDETIQMLCRANQKGRRNLLLVDNMPRELWVEMVTLPLEDVLAMNNIYTLLRGNPTFLVSDILPRWTWMAAPTDNEPRRNSKRNRNRKSNSNDQQPSYNLWGKMKSFLGWK